MSDKPQFDPNKPFEAGDKPAFDPNAAFQTTDSIPKPGALDTALDLGRRALDYTGGAVRTGVAGTVGQIPAYFNDKPSPVHVKDLVETLKGNAPNSDTYLDRMGVPPGDKMYMGNSIFGNPMVNTPREAVGGGLDMLSQYGGTKALGSLLKGVGKSTFAKAFSKADEVLATQNKEPLSQIMWEEGKTPLTKGQVYNSVDDLIPKVSAERNVLEAPVMDSVVTANGNSYLDKVKSRINELKGSGYQPTRDQASAFEKLVAQQEALGARPEVPATPGSAATMEKVAVGSDASGAPIYENRVLSPAVQGSPGAPAQPAPNYQQLKEITQGTGKSTNFGNTTGTENELYKLLGGGARAESYNVANQFQPGLGEDIAAKNARISSLLSILPKAEREAIVAAGKHNITQIDALLAIADPHLEAAKMGGKLIGSTGAKTVTGRAMYGVGNTLGGVAPYTPWATIMNKGQK